MGKFPCDPTVNVQSVVAHSCEIVALQRAPSRYQSGTPQTFSLISTI